MLAGDGFPAAGDPLITFTSYPPGTACLIYYVCRMVTGQAACEWGMLMAQAALLLSCVAPIAALGGKRPWCALAAALTAAWFAVGTGREPVRADGDNVMPMMAVACIALIALRGQEAGGRFWERGAAGAAGAADAGEEQRVRVCAVCLPGLSGPAKAAHAQGVAGDAAAAVAGGAAAPVAAPCACRGPGHGKEHARHVGGIFQKILAGQDRSGCAQYHPPDQGRTLGETYVAFWPERGWPRLRRCGLRACGWTRTHGCCPG